MGQKANCKILFDATSVVAATAAASAATTIEVVFVGVLIFHFAIDITILSFFATVLH